MAPCIGPMCPVRAYSLWTGLCPEIWYKKILLKFAIISYEKVNHVRKFQNAKIGIVGITLSRTGTSLVILMVEPPRAKRPRRRPITKKIWEAIEAGKFGYDVTVRINLWFLNKKFQEIIYLSMFIHNISSKRDRVTTGG